jgi:two-component system sensor histidine kinase BaeS
MVERLLELNRKGEPRLESAPIDELVDEAWDAYAERARARGVELEKHFPDGLEVVTDLEDLSRVLANLLENAINYADENSTIDVLAVEAEGSFEIVVTNDASRAPKDVAERAFEIFWRADAARSDVGVHAGLGLSLCKRIVEALGGQAEASLEQGRFAVTVRLPRAG